MIEREVGILHSVPGSELTITQEGHTEDKRIIKIDMTAENKDSEVNLGHHLEDLKLHQDLPAEIKTGVICKQLNIWSFGQPKIALRRTFLQSRYNIEKKEFLGIKDVPI